MSFHEATQRARAAIQELSARRAALHMCDPLLGAGNNRMTVFRLPGLHILLRTNAGAVSFQPAFLSCYQLHKTLLVAVNAYKKAWLMRRQISRDKWRQSVENTAIKLAGNAWLVSQISRSSAAAADSEAGENEEDDEGWGMPAEAAELMEELGEKSSSSLALVPPATGDWASHVSALAVGTISLATRAAVWLLDTADTAAANSPIGNWVMGLPSHINVLASYLDEHVAALQAYNQSRLRLPQPPGAAGPSNSSSRSTPPPGGPPSPPATQNPPVDTANPTTPANPANPSHPQVPAHPQCAADPQCPSNPTNPTNPANLEHPANPENPAAWSITPTSLPATMATSSSHSSSHTTTHSSSNGSGDCIVDGGGAGDVHVCVIEAAAMHSMGMMDCSISSGQAEQAAGVSGSCSGGMGGCGGSSSCSSSSTGRVGGSSCSSSSSSSSTGGVGGCGDSSSSSVQQFSGGLGAAGSEGVLFLEGHSSGGTGAEAGAGMAGAVVSQAGSHHSLGLLRAVLPHSHSDCSADCGPCGTHVSIPRAESVVLTACRAGNTLSSAITHVLASLTHTNKPLTCTSSLLVRLPVLSSSLVPDLGELQGKHDEADIAASVASSSTSSTTSSTPTSTSSSTTNTSFPSTSTSSTSTSSSCGAIPSSGGFRAGHVLSPEEHERVRQRAVRVMHAALDAVRQRGQQAGAAAAAPSLACAGSHSLQLCGPLQHSLHMCALVEADSGSSARVSSSHPAAEAGSSHPAAAAAAAAAAANVANAAAAHANAAALTVNAAAANAGAAAAAWRASRHAAAVASLGAAVDTDGGSLAPCTSSSDGLNCNGGNGSSVSSSRTLSLALSRCHPINSSVFFDRGTGGSTSSGGGSGMGGSSSGMGGSGSGSSSSGGSSPGSSGSGSGSGSGSSQSGDSGRSNTRSSSAASQGTPAGAGGSAARSPTAGVSLRLESIWGAREVVSLLWMLCHDLQHQGGVVFRWILQEGLSARIEAGLGSALNRSSMLEMHMRVGVNPSLLTSPLAGDPHPLSPDPHEPQPPLPPTPPTSPNPRLPTAIVTSSSSASHSARGAVTHFELGLKVDPGRLFGKPDGSSSEEAEADLVGSVFGSGSAARSDEVIWQGRQLECGLTPARGLLLIGDLGLDQERSKDSVPGAMTLPEVSFGDFQELKVVRAKVVCLDFEAEDARK